MLVSNLVKKFVEKPERMRMGTRKLAQRYKVSEEEVALSRNEAKRVIKLNLQGWIEDEDAKFIAISVQKEIFEKKEIERNEAKIRIEKWNQEQREKLALAKLQADAEAGIPKDCELRLHYHDGSVMKEKSVDCTSEDSIFDVKQAISPFPFKGGDTKNVLVIGDIHLPFTKDGYLEFCREMQEKYNCGTVVHIGDIVDNHAISYHEKDPSGRSAGDEFNLAKSEVKKWYHTFPEVKVCIGNHDALPFRKLFTAGLPKEWLKSYEELLEAPKTWKWDFVHQIEGVLYQHGTGLSGEMASVNAARENRQSTVIGHLHTVCNTRFLASYKDLIFGLTVGCGIDHSKYAFAYGREQTRKPVIACAVVLGGRTPINLTMPLEY